jgi:hypothetical protein
MDPEQLNIAAAFVNELLELNVLLTFGKGKKVLKNAPLFLFQRKAKKVNGK